VEVESRLIVGERVSQAPNDKQELAPAVVAPVESIAADGLCGGGKERASSHGERFGEEGGTVRARRGVPLGEVMKHRLKTAEGKAKYKLRQQTVEPVFGIIKSVMGFRQFLLRGLEKVGLEWQLVYVAYNLKRLHIMNVGRKLASPA
jgi:hypothetical protein